MTGLHNAHLLDGEVANNFKNSQKSQRMNQTERVAKGEPLKKEQVKTEMKNTDEHITSKTDIFMTDSKYDDNHSSSVTGDESNDTIMGINKTVFWLGLVGVVALGAFMIYKGRKGKISTTPVTASAVTA